MAFKRSQQPGRRVQLHRALSKLGWGSRTQAWDWIRGGRVRVDGRIVTDPLVWVDLERQTITRDDIPSAKPAARVVLMLHKPAGVVTTRADERGRRTVYDLLPAGLPWVFPAGRLDADSEGLLILTNDSALSTRLTDPEHAVAKVYQVTLSGRLSEEEFSRLRTGIALPDGPTRPAGVRLLAELSDGCRVEFVLSEGRNRQIRRMCAAVGQKVRRLVRVAIGGLELGELPSGAHRLLDEEEQRRLLLPRL